MGSRAFYFSFIKRSPGDKGAESFKEKNEKPLK
jgi:hypothetical protein